MNGYEYELGKGRMHDFQAEADRCAMVSAALRERKALRQEARARSASRSLRQVWLAAAAAIHSLAT